MRWRFGNRSEILFIGNRYDKTVAGVSTIMKEQPLFRIIVFYHKRPVIRMYETLALTLFTVTFFIYFAIRPTAVTIVGLVKTLAARQDLTAQLDKKISSVFAAQTVYTNLSARLAVLDQALPVEPTLPYLEGSFETLANERQVVLKTVSFDRFSLFGGTVSDQPAVSGESAKYNGSDRLITYPFTLTATGSYSNLYGFVGDLESLQRLVNVNGFSITQVVNQETTSLVLFVSGEAYAAELVPLDQQIIE